ncbi:MAG: formate dehydrogenase iron-sulfur subunit, partial [Baekduia sp.]|nr:formate dehydrogenase iron-sulfur subunit [Baekduia sp.]
ADSPIQENVVPASLAAIGAGLTAAAAVATVFRHPRKAKGAGVGALTIIAAGTGAYEVLRETRSSWRRRKERT